MNILYNIVMFLFVACTLSCHNSAPSNNWQYFGKNYNGSHYYYDAATIVHLASEKTIVLVKIIPDESENIYKLITLFFSWEPTDEDVLKYDNYDHTLLLCEINCMNNTVLSIAAEDYDRNGRILYSSVNDDEDVEEMNKYLLSGKLDITIYPDTVWEDLYNEVCMQCAYLNQDNIQENTSDSLNTVDLAL